MLCTVEKRGTTINTSLTHIQLVFVLIHKMLAISVCVVRCLAPLANSRAVCGLLFGLLDAVRWKVRFING